jgi:mono/diheme cytochrome c family protein
MRNALLFAAVAGAVAAAVACGTGAVEKVGDVAFDPQDSGAILGSDDQAAPRGPAGTGLATGLPCDVQALLENRCLACHSVTSTNPPPLVDYASLTAPSKSDPSKSMAVMALERMKNPASPMPPAPAAAPTEEEIATFADWVAVGTPKGGLCTEPPPDGGAFDAGNLGDAGGDAAPPCTSGQLWTGGDDGSSSMHPGRSCQGCHQAKGGPNYRFAGTVYRNGLHDIDDCNGASAPPALKVIVTDSDNKQVTIPVNAVGNFAIDSVGGFGGGDGFGGGGGSKKNTFRAPYRVAVSDGTTTRAMNVKITSGDCNSCHTAAGAHGAPGRILAP